MARRRFMMRWLKPRSHNTEAARAASPHPVSSSELDANVHVTRRVERDGARGPAAEALSLVVYALVALAALSFHWVGGGQLTDAWADWLAVSAANDGLDPYEDMLVIAARYDLPVNVAAQSESELGPGPWIHPRTPGALMLMAPGSLLDPEEYRLVMLLASVTAVMWIVAFLLPPLTGIRRGLLLLGAPLLIPSYPVFATLEFGTQSAVIAGLVIFGWIRSTQDRQGIAGLAIGVASALKAWPLFLVVPLWLTGRRRAATAAISTTVGTTAAGMLLFGLTPSMVMEAFSAATDRWLIFSPNGSAIGWAVRAGMHPWMAFGLGTVAALAVTWLVARNDPPSAIPAAITMALLLSPLSWAHYDIVLFGVGAWLLTKSSWQRRFAIAWFVAALTGLVLRFFRTPEFTWVGLYTLAGRFLLVTAVVVPALTRKVDRPSPGELVWLKPRDG
jgi:Glycosyltransferase family 87